jgi:DNA-binding XRE family transcriptional regulator
MSTTTITTNTSQDEELQAQMRAFGEAFRQAHQDAKRSKRAIAASVSLDRAGITKIERGKRAPNLSTLLELARAVGSTPAALVAGIGAGRARAGAGGAAGASEPKPEYEGEPPKDPYERMAANLKWARARTGLNQFDLGWNAKVDRSSLSGYETGRLAPNLRTLFKLAMALGLPPSVLLEGVALRNDG